MKVCFNLANNNLALGVENCISSSFGYIIFLDLAILDQKDLVLASITTIMLLLLLPPTISIVLVSLITTNCLVKEPFIVVFSIKINNVAIRLKL